MAVGKFRRLSRVPRRQGVLRIAQPKPDEVHGLPAQLHADARQGRAARADGVVARFNQMGRQINDGHLTQWNTRKGKEGMVKAGTGDAQPGSTRPTQNVWVYCALRIFTELL